MPRASPPPREQHDSGVRGSEFSPSHLVQDIDRQFLLRHQPLEPGILLLHEQVIAKVRQGQKMPNTGQPLIEGVKELQVTETTWYRWLKQSSLSKSAAAPTPPTWSGWGLFVVVLQQSAETIRAERTPQS